MSHMGSGVDIDRNKKLIKIIILTNLYKNLHVNEND